MDQPANLPIALAVRGEGMTDTQQKTGE